MRETGVSTMTKLITKRFALAAATAAIVLAPISAHAGFLDQLFGNSGFTPAPVEQPNSGYSYDSPDRNLGYAPIQRAPRVKKKVAAAPVDKTPNLQKTTDLMSDKTLRPGDAVMMKTGVHVYDGTKTSHHDAGDFVALDKADVSKKTRGDLAAMDVTRRAPLAFVASNDVQEGRSSSGQVITEGYKITDAQGRSIRYVGP